MSGDKKHMVHEIHKPQGHGYVDQKYGKGNRSPINSQVPYVDTSEVPNEAAGGQPVLPVSYGGGNTGNI